jgi:sortase (surface protein transpeptidase)
MTGNETITITIEDPDKNIRLSTCYSILQADRAIITKGEYHNLELDNLIERFDNYRRHQKYEMERI